MKKYKYFFTGFIFVFMAGAALRAQAAPLTNTVVGSSFDFYEFLRVRNQSQ